MLGVEHVVPCMVLVKWQDGKMVRWQDGKMVRW